MKLYYISWHTTGAVYSRCFNSADDREKFRALVDCKSAKVQMWENKRPADYRK